MQWDAGANAGFTGGRPWLPLAPDADVVNVARQRGDAASMLSLHRRLLALRREHPAFSVGAYELVEVTDDVVVYLRAAGPDRCLVALNFGGSAQRALVPPAFRGGTIVLSTAMERTEETAGRTLDLQPDEGVIVA
jgi:alpha-glucosidase